MFVYGRISPAEWRTAMPDDSITVSNMVSWSMPSSIGNRAVLTRHDDGHYTIPAFSFTPHELLQLRRVIEMALGIDPKQTDFLT
jgi:hypothetical protein